MRTLPLPFVRATPFGWLRAASPAQRRTLLAASLGWMLDSFDVMLYALVVSRVRADLHMSAGSAGLIMSATLIAAAVGGTLFGRIADRFGRTRALSASILVYCVCTGLCGLVHTALQLAFCRIALGFGMGGEWAAGAALVAESWPDEHRGKALALVQSSWAVGYALGAALVAAVLPHFGWRPVFFLGVLPALFTFWIRRHVAEPESWRAQSAAGRPASLRDLFQGPLALRTLSATAMNAATLFAWWGLFFWVPAFLSGAPSHGGRGLGIVQTSTWTILMQVGSLLGYVSFGYFADRFGRRPTYIGYLLMAALVVQFYARAHSTETLLWLGPLVGFWGSGYFSGFAVIASELFPTSIRASAMGFTYNTGRVVSAAAPYVVGRASESSGIGPALTITSIAFLVAALIALTVPETLRRGGSPAQFESNSW